MTYTTILTSGNASTTKPIPMKGRFYNYSFLNNQPKGSMTAIRVGAGRSVEHVRRAVQITSPTMRHTKALDNILLVW